jgi:hypothetical protein
LEYFKPKQFQPSFLRALSGVSTAFTEPAIVILELLRLHLLNGNPFTPTDSDTIQSM